MSPAKTAQGNPAGFPRKSSCATGQVAKIELRFPKCNRLQKQFNLLRCDSEKFLAELHMLPIALNHMTMPSRSARGLCEVAKRLGCVGVELRNDLDQPLFDGISPGLMAAVAAENSQRLLALAEVTAFNAEPGDKLASVAGLAALARDSGAAAIVLIPHVADAPVDRGTQRQALREALHLLQRILEDHGITGLIEPLGFANSSLRHKEDVVAVLADMGRPDCFGMIHDTFHHALAGGGPVYADLTHIVHISGVTDPTPALADMKDSDRGLVDARDRLGTLAQLHALQSAGYTGPASFEAFAPEVHVMKDPATAVARSIAFITSQMAQSAPAWA